MVDKNPVTQKVALQESCHLSPSVGPANNGGSPNNRIQRSAIKYGELVVLG